MLICSEAVLAVKISMSKSELVMLGDEHVVNHKARIMGCKRVNLPIRYMGMSLGTKFKDFATWNLVVNMFKS